MSDVPDCKRVAPATDDVVAHDSDDAAAPAPGDTAAPAPGDTAAQETGEGMAHGTEAASALGSDAPAACYEPTTEANARQHAVVRLRVWHGVTRLGRLARLALLVLANAVFFLGFEYGKAHEGVYPYDISVGELLLVSVGVYVLGSQLVTFVTPKLVRLRLRTLGVPPLDLARASYDELEYIHDKTFDLSSSQLIGMGALWLLFSLCSCDRLVVQEGKIPGTNALGMTQPAGALLLLLIVLGGIVLAFLLYCEFDDAVKRAYGWSFDADQRFSKLQSERRARWVIAHPEKARRAREAYECRLEEEERRKQERAAEKARGKQERQRRLEEMREEGRRRAAIERARKKNPALCPGCGGANVVVLGTDVKPSLMGAAIGSAGGFKGAIAGSLLLSKKRRELMCRDCGTRWFI